MDQAALLLRTPGREDHIRLAFASSTAAIAVMAVVEGLVLMGLGWDWGYKLISDPFRQVIVLDFAVCHPGTRGVSLLSAFPRDLNNGYQRLIGLQPLQSSTGPFMTWPVDSVRTVMSVPGRSCAVAGSADGSLYLVDVSSAESAPRRFGRHGQGAVDALACSPDSRLLLSLGRQCLCVWDLRCERLLWQSDASYSCGVFDLCSDMLICGSDEGVLVQMHALTGEVDRELVQCDVPICHIDLAPDGRRIAVLCANTVLMYDLEAGRIAWSREHWRWPVRFSPQGELLGTFGYVPKGGWRVVLWDAQTGNEVASLAGHTHMIFGVSFSADGSLYSWSGDRTIRQWDPVLHRQMRALPAIAASQAR